MGRINASKRFKWMFCKTQQMRERERERERDRYIINSTTNLLFTLWMICKQLL